MEKLFIYGTLQNKNVQLTILGHTPPVRNDTLVGYATRQIKINDKAYPIAVPDSNSKILGKIIEISDRELLLIDDYETKAYQRIKVTLTSGHTSWVYCQPIS
jgi:gamma-glutamylcyclotransferase (GGCT)/AIG2-like uncharacterized protein YtfP